MNENLLDRFNREVSVTYRGENYLVRNNGAIYRKSRPEKRKRKLDQVWTFGNPCNSSGYMTIASDMVHRIVATAFHGEQLSDMHIVDHIDTNRRNNRADNIRWITRLDNILSNPITLRRIEIAYGSLDNFFNNPSKPKETRSLKTLDWMRTVSADEAQACRKKLLNWAASGKLSNGGALGEWLYINAPNQVETFENFPVASLTPMASQRNWKTPSEFPACPYQIENDPLHEYCHRLTYGSLFSRNEYGQSTTVVASHSEVDSSLGVICNMGNESAKEWALSRVTFEDEKFCHENVGSFFTLQGAIKQYCQVLGIPWDDSIDDYA